MTLTAEQIDHLTDRLVALYGEAERVMLHRIARALARGLDSPRWAEEKLLEYQLLQARLRGDLNSLAGKSVSEVAAAVMQAYNAGQASALADLAVAGLAGQVAAGANPAGLASVRALIGETATSVLDSHQRILRAAGDIYRAVVAEASPLQLVGAVSRREAAQRALSTFAEHGITSFVDRAGRRWSMTGYTEMATRAAARRAQVDGHADQLLAHGEDLTIVSDHPRECALCRPWEGKVLSLSGSPRIDGVQVAGTLDQARAAGLLHPGCRHTIGLYLPGVTEIPTGTADPEGDAARQELRRLERGVRAWRRREAAAMSPEEAAGCRARVREWQARIRQHVARTGAKRQPQRERLGAAL
ncbi:MAG: capsid protein [Gammaproteobacteria bacterium]|nr:capsid protein [Gammaproteobacteria bacterium]